MESRIIKFVLFLLFVNVGFKASSDVRDEADSLYASANYKEALALYLKTIDEEGTNAEILYNTGNSYYRVGNLSKAILYYERALRLDPTNEKVKTNLEFVNSKTIDNPGTRFGFWETVTNAVSLSLKPNVWAWIALVLFVLTIGCVSLYLFAPVIRLKKYGFFGAIVLFILFLFAIFISYRAKYLSSRTDEAIVMAKSTILSTSPRAPMNRNEEAMLLHEGIKVVINDSVSVKTDSIRTVWYDVSIDAGHRAWINGNDIEKIVN